MLMRGEADFAPQLATFSDERARVVDFTHVVTEHSNL